MSWWDVARGRQTWSDYISAQEQIKGFESASRQQSKDNEKALARSTMQINLTQRDYQIALEQGLGALGTGINLGIGQLANTIEVGLDRMADGIDQLNADFNLLMGDVIWKLEVQNKNLASIIQTLQAPLDTAAKELRQRAEDAYRNAWYEEALSDFLESERKNYQDFAVHRSIANIYLFHLIDLAKALEYFRKAAKYALPRDTRQAAEGHYFAAIVCGAGERLKEASDHVRQAVELNPQFHEAHYLYAGVAAMLGETATATEQLGIAIAGDARYYERAKAEFVTDRFPTEIEEFLSNLLAAIQTQVSTGTTELERRSEQLRHQYIILTPGVQEKVIELTHRVRKTIERTKTYKEWLLLPTVLSESSVELERIYKQPYYIAKEFNGHTNSIISVSFDSYSQLLFSGSLDNTVRIWDITTLNQKVFLNTDDRVRIVAISPDGRLLAFGEYQGMVRVWETSTDKEITTFREGLVEIQQLAFSPDGRLLAGAFAKTIFFWDVASRRTLQYLTGHTNTVTSIAFHPDGRLLVSGGSDATIRFWDVPLDADAAGIAKEKHIIGEHRGSVTSIVFSSDGQMMASGSSDKTICLWRVGSDRPTQTLSGHKGAISSLALSPNGHLLASVSNSSNLRIWDTGSGMEIQAIDNVRGPLAYSPDGEFLAATNEQNTITLRFKGIRTEEEQRAQKEIQQINIKRINDLRIAAEARLLRQQRREAGQCESCGVKLGMLDKIGGSVLCKAHR